MDEYGPAEDETVAVARRSAVQAYCTARAASRACGVAAHEAREASASDGASALKQQCLMPTAGGMGRSSPSLPHVLPMLSDFTY
jgi:hypothetical protein